jgi:Domain of unknown function (DUF5658)
VSADECVIAFKDAEDSQVTQIAGLLTVQIFLYLQLLDFLTTMLGFRLGASEATPFVRGLMQIGPVAGVVLSKIIAVGIGAVCIWLNRVRLISWINYWYAALVIWNIAMVFRALKLN